MAQFGLGTLQGHSAEEWIPPAPAWLPLLLSPPSGPLPVPWPSPGPPLPGPPAVARMEAGTGERQGSQRPKQSLESGVPGRRKGLHSPGLQSLGEKLEAVSLEGRLGCRPGLEDPVGMQGLSPGMEILQPLGLAVDGNELSNCLTCGPLTGEHSIPKIYLLLLIMCQALF